MPSRFSSFLNISVDVDAVQMSVHPSEIYIIFDGSDLLRRRGLEGR
jgi:hypothetical protein